MQNQIALIPPEQAALVREKMALLQRVRALEEEATAREKRVAELEDELRRKRPIVHKYFAGHMDGWDRSRWHADLRADIVTAGKVAAVLFTIAYVAQSIFWRVTGLA